MADNLNIKGIESDEPTGSKRLKPRGKRKKPWAIEWRLHRSVTSSLSRMLGLRDWCVLHRYTTRARRDQAYATMVKKASRDELDRRLNWRQEYRKRDD